MSELELLLFKILGIFNEILKLELLLELFKISGTFNELVLSSILSWIFLKLSIFLLKIFSNKLTQLSLFVLS